MLSLSFIIFSFLDYCLFWTELNYWAFRDVCQEICTYSAMKYMFHPFVLASQLGHGLLQWNSCEVSASSCLWLWSSIRNIFISESRPLELCSLPFSSHMLCCNKEIFSHPPFKKKNTCPSLVYFYNLFIIIIIYRKIFLSVDHSSCIFWFILAIDKSVSLDFWNDKSQIYHLPRKFRISAYHLCAFSLSMFWSCWGYYGHWYPIYTFNTKRERFFSILRRAYIKVSFEA